MSAARLAVGLAVVVLLTAPARAADNAQIQEAIRKGGEYLSKTCGPDAGYTGGGYGIGSASLAGLALLEAGVPKDHPAVLHITRMVRLGCLANSQTYHTALALLYLDRHGDPADVPAIQFLGVRLYAGLTAFGGWGYNCGQELPPAEAARLQAALQQTTLTGTKPGPKPKPDTKGFLPAPPPDGKAADPDAPPPGLHPEVAKYYIATRQAIRAGRGGEPGDNSNTQFGLIGLWVASRHGVPADDAFALIESRFISTQNKTDYGWSYTGGPVASASTPAMTCAGLLGLAVGAARGKGPLPGGPPKDPNDPFTSPPKGKDGKGKADLPEVRNKQAIENGLAALGRVLQAGQGGGGFANFVGLGNEFYLLWSVERVAVAYGLDKIGDVDWHQVGADFLVPAQGADGAWTGTGYQADVNTAFAILFLSKSNFVRDLSRKIQGVAGAELRGGGAALPLMTAPKGPNSGTSSGPSGSGSAPPPAPPADPGPGLPPVAPGAAGDPIADGLVDVGADEWPTKLAHARDTKGSEYTSGLVRAIGRLDGDRQRQAREALAERLCRMTASTLRGMLKGDEPELRRAACLACAMKEERGHIPDLIDKLTDPQDLVVRAARAGLKSLTERDFGPPTGASDDAKAKAQADWKKWYEAEGK
jgi:hypothetical protein